MFSLRTLAVCWIVPIAAHVRAEAPMPMAEPVAIPLPNLAWSTLGGEQVWSDELVYGAWRIQRNVLTGHCRLLDEQDVRRAWGTSEQCREALAAARQSESLKPLDGRAVVTLHGFGRSRDHMAGIGKYLAEQADCTWINVSYASTRRSLDEHALALAGVIAGLEGIDEIDFVCHSLGNLVVRRYLGEANAEQPRWQTDPRIKRIVMLGPPNNGARMAGLLADLFRDNLLMAKLAGPSAMQLARDWQEASKVLATPACEFGVIAGGCGDERGYNPLLDGDDDLIVAVEETRLAGARDFRLVPCRHGRLMDDSQVREYVLAFLKHGYFTADAERQPIASERTDERQAARP
jgi:pimeloyl-ACP methyl ester carboxylesterase